MTDRLPLFPLSSALFPGLVLPLNVFEDRYRALARDLLALPEGAPRRFGVVAIRNGQEVSPTGQDGRDTGPAAGLGDDPLGALYGVGCVADATGISERGEGGEDGYDMVGTGLVRFRLLSVDASGEYLTGEVEELPDEPGAGAAALVPEVTRAFRAYQKKLAGSRERTLASQEFPDDPTVMSYLVAAAMIMEMPDKQRLLEADDSAARLTEELRLLRRETALIDKLPSLPAVELAQQAICVN
ncbi:LON peptidase substrate-binding domain-containing protein [Actinacidiphila yeochonensis]|uniref:LON peptidase substrate-binding domain-containing protein n=1 Tax=Actinacidiphila yeochonensis TaxID=89050 RepID=UPI00055A369B|nr:LON peptidase substrate-binding domain-containing protein [Actinacidiphila yeochonensis]